MGTIFVNGGYQPPKKPFPHLLHLILTVLSFGFWLPVWIIHRLFSDR